MVRPASPVDSVRGPTGLSALVCDRPEEESRRRRTTLFAARGAGAPALISKPSPDKQLLHRLAAEGLGGGRSVEVGEGGTVLVDELAAGMADAGDGEGGEQGSGQGEGAGAGAEAAGEDPGAGDGEGDRRDPDEPLGGLFVLLDRDPRE